MISVSDRLKTLAELFERKNNDYGDAYLKVGRILKELYPDGININDVREHNEYQIIGTIIGKIIRYSNLRKDTEVNFESAEDTLNDISVYCQMIAVIIKPKKE